MKIQPIITNEAPGKPAHSLFCRLLNKEDVTKPVEVLIYDVIGKDWDGAGFDAKDFVTQLKGLDESRALTLRVNSRGGIVDEGIAIYNRLREWKGKTVAIVDGSAASIASVLIMGADEVRMPKSAEILIHEAHAVAYGHAEDMRELANRLDGASNRIAEIYAEKTGKSADEMRAYMRKTTVFNGTQAKDIGLVDVVTDEKPLYNFQPGEIENFRVPQRDEGGKQPKPPAADSGENTMTKEQIIAAIKKLGGTVAENATVEQLTNQLTTLIEAKAQPATPPAPAPKDGEGITAKDILDLRNDLAAEKKARETERKSRITAQVDQLIANNQIPGAMKDKAVARAMADETILDEYRAMPAVEPGVEPVAVNIEITGESPKEIEKAVLKNFGGKPGLTPAEARERGANRAKIINANMKKIMPLMNANTVSADLKRTVIMQQMIRAFAIRLLPLSAFSTVFNGIRLEGTDKVAVPYMPLQTTTSVDFVEGTGYTTFVDTNTSVKTITVDKRKFQALKWSSQELSRQPYLWPAQNAMLQAEQLAIDVVNDVLSLVTSATYGTAGKISPASAFDSDDIMDLKGVADLANWPAAMRSIILNSAYDVNVLKDTGVKSALNFGDANPIKEGRIVRIGGFDYYADARVPANSENLQGFIAWKSALLFAAAPVTPTPEVRSQLASYEEVIDPESGATFSYRLWGNPDTDQSREAIECAYGRVAGETAALKRITSA
jgi:ATP-dependent protease ClpP protease subunit